MALKKSGPKRPTSSKKKPTTPRAKRPAGASRADRSESISKKRRRSTPKAPATKRPAGASRAGRSETLAEKRRRSAPKTPAAKRPARAAAPPPASQSEEIQAKLASMQSQFDGLQSSMLLTNVQSEMAEVETALSLLPTEIEELRTRGYVFRSFLENKVGVLSSQWDEMKDKVADEVAKHTRELERDANTAERTLQQAMGGIASHVTRAESTIETLESKVYAARSAVEAMYEPLQQNVDQTTRQIEEIRWLLDEIDEASFELHPVEDPVAACKAQYIEREDEGPEGVLYLTDERLIFERKEEVATKKFLIITTEKETIQEFIFDVSVGHIDEAKASDKKKFLRRKEMLELLFAPEADLSGATLRLLNADNEEWAALIGRVKSGEIAKERTQPKDEAAEEAARSAPTKCPTCGATLSIEIVRGMNEISCEYCGSVIRL